MLRDTDKRTFLPWFLLLAMENQYRCLIDTLLLHSLFIGLEDWEFLLCTPQSSVPLEIKFIFWRNLSFYGWNLYPPSSTGSIHPTSFLLELLGSQFAGFRYPNSFTCHYFQWLTSGSLSFKLLNKSVFQLYLAKPLLKLPHLSYKAAFASHFSLKRSCLKYQGEH